jgi:hypothetical protein
MSKKKEKIAEEVLMAGGNTKNIDIEKLSESGKTLSEEEEKQRVEKKLATHGNVDPLVAEARAAGIQIESEEPEKKKAGMTEEEKELEQRKIERGF